MSRVVAPPMRWFSFHCQVVDIKIGEGSAWEPKYLQQQLRFYCELLLGINRSAGRDTVKVIQDILGIADQHFIHVSLQ